MIVLRRFDLLRPFGHMVSVGVPIDPLPFSGPECYSKNFKVQFGRCPAHSVFDDALDILLQVQGELTCFIDVWKYLEEAPRAYELFDKAQVGKIVFKLD